MWCTWCNHKAGTSCCLLALESTCLWALEPCPLVASLLPAGTLKTTDLQSQSMRAWLKQRRITVLFCALVLTWIWACTGVQQQVAGDQIFDGHVGTQFDALQMAVRSVQVDRKHVTQVHHQARPAHTHRGRTHQTLKTDSHVSYECSNAPLGPIIFKIHLWWASQEYIMKASLKRLYIIRHPRTLRCKEVHYLPYYLSNRFLVS